MPFVLLSEPLRSKKNARIKMILFNLSGHGHFDMASYEKYFGGELNDYEYPVEKIREALANLPRLP
jgi:hypothetical protein